VSAAVRPGQREVARRRVSETARGVRPRERGSRRFARGRPRRTRHSFVLIPDCSSPPIGGSTRLRTVVGIKAQPASIGSCTTVGRSLTRGPEDYRSPMPRRLISASHASSVWCSCPSVVTTVDVGTWAMTSGVLVTRAIKSRPWNHARIVNPPVTSPSKSAMPSIAVTLLAHSLVIARTSACIFGVGRNPRSRDSNRWNLLYWATALAQLPSARYAEMSARWALSR
jgi:hypothetical protein